jgi:hypothetical protein
MAYNYFQTWKSSSAKKKKITFSSLFPETFATLLRKMVLADLHAGNGRKHMAIFGKSGVGKTRSDQPPGSRADR